MFKKLILIATVVLTVSVHAGLKVPSSVFTLDELAEAKAEAAEDKEPLIFVYTDPGTT